jgi:hypothetical protein
MLRMKFCALAEATVATVNSTDVPSEANSRRLISYRHHPWPIKAP